MLVVFALMLCGRNWMLALPNILLRSPVMQVWQRKKRYFDTRAICCGVTRVSPDVRSMRSFSRRNSRNGWSTMNKVIVKRNRSWPDYDGIVRLTKYDARRFEALLNGFGQRRTKIDGRGSHFLRIRSPESDALPLLLTHGWPGSVLEFGDVITKDG